MKTSDLSERALIARLRARVPTPPEWVLTGIGDDAAVLKPARGMVDVVTTDALVETVHFRRDWSTAADIGHKAMAANISDLASMGATPRAVLLSLAVPADYPLADFDALVGAVIDTAAAARAPLVGGNLTRAAGALMVDITAIGAVRPRRVMRRAGARPGDRLFVTGRLGAAAAGLRLLTAGAGGDTGESLTDEMAECVATHRRPTARLRTGTIVANNRAASACMDLSDGLADAVSQICEASGCGAEITRGAVPAHPGATPDEALAGGDDYELLFAVPKRRVRKFLAAIGQAGETGATDIGVCTKATEVVLVDGEIRSPLPDGFRHF